MTEFLSKIRAFISEEDRPMSKKTFRIYLWLLRGLLIATILIVCLKWGERDLFFNLLSLTGIVSAFVLIQVLEKQNKAQSFSEDKSLKRETKNTPFFVSFFVVWGFSCSMMRQGCNTMRQLFARLCFLPHLCSVKNKQRALFN